MAAVPVIEEPSLISVMIHTASAPQDNPPISPLEPMRQIRGRRERGRIEMGLGDATVRIGVGADTHTITAVIKASSGVEIDTAKEKPARISWARLLYIAVLGLPSGHWW